MKKAGSNGPAGPVLVLATKLCGPYFPWCLYTSIFEFLIGSKLSPSITPSGV
jgi:hypothetical protein